MNIYNLGIKWDANKKAWMTTVIFGQFILDIERKMVLAQKEKVLLLYDFFGHQVPNVGSRLWVTRLEFLPTNNTSCEPNNTLTLGAACRLNQFKVRKPIQTITLTKDEGESMVIT